MSSTPNRKPGGVPGAGQFAPGARTAAPVSLDAGADDATDEDAMFHQLVARARTPELDRDEVDELTAGDQPLLVRHAAIWHAADRAHAAGRAARDADPLIRANALSMPELDPALVADLESDEAVGRMMSVLTAYQPAA